jgi:hypothetical protein
MNFGNHPGGLLAIGNFRIRSIGKTAANRADQPEFRSSSMQWRPELQCRILPGAMAAGTSKGTNERRIFLP